MADLRLSSGDIQRLNHTAASLLGPLDSEDWPNRVNRCLKELLGADMATFQLADPARPEGDPLYSDEVDVDHLNRYFPLLDEIESEFHALGEAQRLGVFDRPSIFGGRMDAYYESEYFHEFIEPIRAFGLLGMGVPVDEADVPPMVYLHQQHPSREGFGDRGRQLLRLVYPHFEAGVRSYYQLHRIRDDLIRTIDTVPDPVLIFDHMGRCVHRTSAFTERLADTERADRIVAAATELVTSGLRYLELSRTGGVRGLSEKSLTSTNDVEIGPDRYRLRLSWLRETSVSELLVLVLVEAPDTGGIPDSDRLRERFGLTTREAEVATLLVQRLTNAEIAERLVISPHTARHHTERVLRKLGVRSRNAVRDKLRCWEQEQ